jgi:PAS domain S-box-containing protein
VRFTHRILAMPVLTALLFALAFVVAFGNLRETSALLERLQSELFAAVSLTHQLEIDALRLRNDLDAAVAVRDPEQVDDAAAVADRFRANVEQGRQLASMRGPDLAALGTAFDRYDTLARRVALALIEVRGIPDERLLNDADAMNAAYQELQGRVDALNAAQVVALRTAMIDTEQRLRDRARTITVLAVGAVLVLVLLAVLAIVAIVRPLRKLRLATAAIARGDLDTELDVDDGGDDDLGQLAVSFREMQHALEADIAHREEVERALRESEQRLALSLDAANDGIWDIDLQAGTFYVSDRFAAILGYTPEEKPRTYEEMRASIDGLDDDELERLFREERSDHREVAVDARMRRKDGALAWVQIKGRAVERADDGSPRRLVGTISDISARKAAEEELHRAQDRLLQSEKLAGLGRLVAGLAHELNSPLGALMSSTDLTVRSAAILRDGGCLEADARMTRALAALERSAAGTTAAAARLKSLLGGLERFTALDRADLQEADVHELLDATVTVMGEAAWQGVTLCREYGTLPRVLCYPGPLNQLFLSLLRNAVEAVDGDGTVTVRTTAPDDETVRIAVADTGRGIPAHELPGLFEPRFRDGAGRVHLGWGLVTAARIAAEHGGRITVASEPGEGSTFSVTLPVRPQPVTR